MKKTNKKGFTLVELVIVIAVIAILAAVLIPVFSNLIGKANESAALQEARNAFEAYMVEEAENLTGNENLVIESGDYYYEVKNLQFNAVKLDSKPTEYEYVEEITDSTEAGTYYVKVFATNKATVYAVKTVE
ncbi:MAG: type II secretion system protein [Clostridia bacterium]|nr:type II secretion system protein [Clostridia bacterium]